MRSEKDMKNVKEQRTELALTVRVLDRKIEGLTSKAHQLMAKRERVKAEYDALGAAPADVEGAPV